MAERKPRRRLVFFRVSDDEYERIRNMRAEIGVRSVSELARTAVQQFTAMEAARKEQFSDLLKGLEGTVGQLGETVRELHAALTARKQEEAKARSMHA